MSEAEHDVEERRLQVKFGLRNGWLVGLALALGVWTLDAIFLVTGPVRPFNPSLLLGILALVLLGALAGWLGAVVRRAWFSALVWIGAAVGMVWVIGHVPYEGRSLMVWLADRRAWGLPVYPFSDAAQTGMWLSGFFIVLVLGFLGLMQPYRLEGVSSEADPSGRLGGRGWFMLLLPLPLVLAVGFVADSMIGRPLRVAPQLVNQVIRTGRTYSGDLFELGLERGINYSAIAGLREQMSEDYTLSLAEVDLGVADTVFVAASFDNYTWIYCRVVADQVTSCYDASPPYFQGLVSVITTGEKPADCPQCSFRFTSEQRDWLLSRGEALGPSPNVGRLAQWGSYVLVQAESSDGDAALQCLFEGVSPIILSRCWEVRSRN